MSSWTKSSGGGRRNSGNKNGSAQQLRLFRRTAPYPTREERAEELKAALDSYEELEQMQNYTGNSKFELKNQTNAKAEGNTPADRRKNLYQRFYRQVQEDRKPADCVVLSVTNQCLDYPKSLSQCLQERGLSVEMLYLQVESGLTRALQDVRADGSPLCILVEQTNVALSSCTVIIFSESLKIHRNMPKDQAMDFVQAEYKRGLNKERPPRDPADAAAQASQLLDDFLDREKMARHTVPSGTRHLLSLLADGVHLYPEELQTVAEYVHGRQDYIRASNTEGERGNMLPPGLGKPPPLLPTPPGPPPPQPGSGGPMMDLPPPPPVPLLPTPDFSEAFLKHLRGHFNKGSYPKTKPPPLLSLHGLPGPSLGSPLLRGPMPFGGPGLSRGPLLHHPLPPQFHPGPSRGPHGPRGTPPSLKSSRPPLLSSPGCLLPRPLGPHH